MIEGITVLGDILRPDGSGQPGGVDRATIWLFDAIKRQVNLACGLPIDVIAVDRIPSLHKWLDASRSSTAAHQFWAQNYAELASFAELDAILVHRLQHRFCIGYELAPWSRRLLASIGVPYIDLRLHPVRFLDDLLFAARASEPATQTALIAMAVAETEVIATAGLREAMCHMISQATFPSNTLLVVGQRPLDCTQIAAGAFYNAFAQAAEIHAICARYAAVLLKPHPLEPNHTLLEIAAGAPNVAGVVADNIYRLLSLPQIAAVLTVNSSIAYEAPYFGKRVHTLAPLPLHLGWRGAEDQPNLYASVNDLVLSVDFWRHVLAPHTTVSRRDGMLLPPKANRLRIALDSFWNFQEIDTDRIPGHFGT